MDCTTIINCIDRDFFKWRRYVRGFPRFAEREFLVIEMF